MLFGVLSFTLLVYNIAWAIALKELCRITKGIIHLTEGHSIAIWELVLAVIEIFRLFAQSAT